MKIFLFKFIISLLRYNNLYLIFQILIIFSSFPETTYSSLFVNFKDLIGPLSIKVHSHYFLLTFQILIVLSSLPLAKYFPSYLLKHNVLTQFLCPKNIYHKEIKITKN
jgi:hypothetical protein